jgi:hypothetical protein
LSRLQQAIASSSITTKSFRHDPIPIRAILEEAGGFEKVGCRMMADF